MAIKRCKASFAVMVKGAPRVVTAGQLVDDADPVIKGREANFEDVETYVSDQAARHAPRVEQATAEPGEKRSVSRPATKKTAAARKPEPKSDEGGTK